MENVRHKIRAYLYDNLLTQDNPNDFIARVSSERSLNTKEVCTSAVARGGSDVSASSMEHSVELFFKEMAYQLCDGFSVNTGYFTATPLIKGIFDSANESFNTQKHSILFQFNQGDKLRAEIPNIEVDILGVAESGAAILQVKDVKTGTVNDLITPGRNLKIAGYKIKVTGDNASNGIFFVNTVTDARVAVPADDIVTNNPSELIIVIPNLPAGTYTLEVVTQFTGGSITLNMPRTGKLDKILTVR